MRAANRPEADKSEVKTMNNLFQHGITLCLQVIKSAEAHLTSVQLERSHYKFQCDECKKAIRDMCTIDETYTPPPVIPSDTTTPTTKHFSFDMAQQVICISLKKTIIHSNFNTGALPQRPSTAWSNVFLNTTEMCDLRHLL